MIPRSQVPRTLVGFAAVLSVATLNNSGQHNGEPVFCQTQVEQQPLVLDQGRFAFARPRGLCRGCPTSSPSLFKQGFISSGDGVCCRGTWGQEVWQADGCQDIYTPLFSRSAKAAPGSVTTKSKQYTGGAGQPTSSAFCGLHTTLISVPYHIWSTLAPSTWHQPLYPFLQQSSSSPLTHSTPVFFI